MSARIWTPELEEALRWYGERAADLERYLEAKPRTDASMAVMAELSLDAGGRARRALGRQP